MHCYPLVHPEPAGSFHRHRFALLVVVLFLLAQTSAIIHAQVHDFHEHDEWCHVFSAVEKQSQLAVITNAAPSLLLFNQEALPCPVFDSSLVSRVYFFARAPPRLFHLR